MILLLCCDCSAFIVVQSDDWRLGATVLMLQTNKYGFTGITICAIDLTCSCDMTCGFLTIVALNRIHVLHLRIMCNAC